MGGLSIIAHFAIFLFLTNSLNLKAQILQVTDIHHIQTYIVHVEKPEGSGKFLAYQDLESWHRSFLPHTTLESGKPRMVYSYQHAISGFAARLTRDELKVMETMDGFLHAEPDRSRPLATTYTPEFLGLRKSNGAWSSNKGEGIIIGVIDTGVLPTHVSFKDVGMPPPPSKWKGACGFKNFTCNNKIIGGAAFNGQLKVSPEDDEGHGTHVASTVAGRRVTGANYKGAASGTASGVAPKSHLAIYKVCFTANCRSSDILAGMDQAIADGVDVLSMSYGGYGDRKFNLDSVTLGSLSAVSRGIIAVSSAGNHGEEGARTLCHSAPWVLTVGAATTDRSVIFRFGKATTTFGNRPSPTLATFSSRGPSTANGGILKPDVLAPGVSILAGSPFADGGGALGSSFVFLSGTSMATPHVAGVIALVKNRNPSWSPAAVQSAIVTTAHQSDLDGNTIVDERTGQAADIFSMGAGQVDPSAALDPGLVYDLNPNDYIPYFCGLGYTDKEVSLAFHRQIQCSLLPKLQPWELNYPSIGVSFRPDFTETVLARTVTNVGPSDSVYSARVTIQAGVQVRLSRHEISFVEGGPNQASFTVEINLTASDITDGTTFRGKLEWISASHTVISPIAILYEL